MEASERATAPSRASSALPGARDRVGRALFAPALLTIAAYLVAGKVGIALTVAEGVVTPVWAPSGIAVAAIVLYGYRIWPAIALGAFLTNATSDVSIVTAAGIAVGNTLEALAALFLLGSLGFRAQMQRVRDVTGFLAAALPAAGIAATNGATVLAGGGEIAWSEWGSRWLLWWFGDAVGIVLVGPLLLVWLTGAKASHLVARRFEGIALLGALVATSIFVFQGERWHFPYALFPLLVWAVIRFKQHGATLGMLIVGAGATWGTVDGAVVVTGATATQSVQILQALIVTMGIAIFMLAASLAERDSARELLAEAQAIARVGSWEWDIVSGAVTWSDEMFRIYGYEPGAIDLTFERAMERVEPEDASRVASSLEESFRRRSDGPLPLIEYRIRWPDGMVRTLRGRGAVVFLEGRPVRAVGTVEDVSEDVALHRALQDALDRERAASEELRGLDEMKNTFISAVSHDLRSPLAVILGFAQTLMRRGDELSPAQVNDLLSRIVVNSSRAGNLLTNLLDADRLSRSAVRLSTQSVDVSDLVLAVVDSLETGSRTVHRDLERVEAEVDPTLVERMVENLVTNSLRHTPESSELWVRVAGDEASVQIFVEDSGPGVPDDEKKTIFEAFERGGSTAGGTGLGLYLVKSFASMHGGTVSVDDRDGGGASFRVRLPRAASGAREPGSERSSQPEQTRVGP